MPAGNAAPPRPRSPDSFSASTICCGESCQRLCQREQAVVGAVIRDRQRIDFTRRDESSPVAGAQARATRPGPAERERMAVCSKAASNSDATSATPTGPNPSLPAAVCTSTSGSSQYAPREPLRTSSISMPRVVASARSAAATSSAPSEQALVSLGTNSLHRHAPGSRGGRAQQQRQALCIDATMNRIVDANAGAAGAIAEAIHRLQAPGRIGRDLTRTRYRVAALPPLRAPARRWPDRLRRGTAEDAAGRPARCADHGRNSAHREFRRARDSALRRSAPPPAAGHDRALSAPPAEPATVRREHPLNSCSAASTHSRMAASGGGRVSGMEMSCMKGHMLADKARNEIVAVIVSRLHPQRERVAGGWRPPVADARA